MKPGFDGQIFDRACELVATEPLPMTFNASDQVADVAGETAVIHGINTLMHNGKASDFVHSQIQSEFAVYRHRSQAMLLDHGRKR